MLYCKLFCEITMDRLKNFTDNQPVMLYFFTLSIAPEII